MLVKRLRKELDAVQQAKNALLQAEQQAKNALLQAEQDSHNSSKPPASDGATRKPYIQLLIVFILILVLYALFILLQMADEQTRRGIIIGVLFCFIPLSVIAIGSSSLFIVKRRRLFSFFGISHNRPNISIYVSRQAVLAAEGTEPVTRGFTGYAIPVPEYNSAKEIRDLFRSNLVALMPKRLEKTFHKIGIIFADIDPQINPSPPEAFDPNESKDLFTNLIVIGSGLSNTASHYYLDEQLTSPFYFSKKENERVLIERKNDNGKEVEIPGRSQHRELAIIQRIKDDDHGGISVFICAGLGSSATFGSALYLKKHWQDLQRTYGPHDFAFCLEFEGQKRDSEEVKIPTYAHQKWRKCDRSGRSAIWIDGIPQIKHLV